MTMQNLSRLVLSFILVAFLLGSGCTHAAPGPSSTPQTTTMPVVTAPQSQVPTPESTCSLIPGPVQTVPDYETVSISVDRNTITENPTITTRFNGGLGLGMVQRMTVTVIRSDCVTEQELRDSPKIGTSVTQMGTTGTDRVVVAVLMTSGEQYTVIDGDYPFPATI